MKQKWFFISLLFKLVPSYLYDFFSSKKISCGGNLLSVTCAEKVKIITHIFLMKCFGFSEPCSGKPKNNFVCVYACIKMPRRHKVKHLNISFSFFIVHSCARDIVTTRTDMKNILWLVPKLLQRRQTSDSTLAFWKFNLHREINSKRRQSLSFSKSSVRKKTENAWNMG